MAKTDTRPREALDPNYRRNYFLGVLNGALFMCGTTFVDPSTVLPAFILHFTQSRFVVGLAGSLYRMGWSLPQLLISNHVERLRYKMPFYWVSNLIRMSLLAAVVPLVYFGALEHPWLVLVGFFVLFGVGSLLGGGAGLPFTDIVGRMLPAGVVGRFYAQRFFFGAGLMGTGAGLVVRWVLGRGDLFAFPQNYVVIFSLAVGFMLAGVVAFHLIREPPARETSRAQPLGRTLTQVPELLRRDSNFRNMLLSRLLLSGAWMSLPFYTVLAVTEFRIPAAVVGTFVMVRQLTGMLGNLFWARLSQRAGNRAVIRAAAASQVVVPAYALLLVLLVGPFQARIPQWGRIGLFLPIYVVLGATMFGEIIGYTSFVINIAPEGRRPTYIGLMNTAMGLAAVAPALGGVLADLFGFPVVFAVSLVMVVAAFLLTARLRDPLGGRPSRG